MNEWFIIKGNDEVYYDCWKSNPNITEWMEKMNFSQYHELGMIFFLFILVKSFLTHFLLKKIPEAYYSKKILDIAKEINKKVTVWQGKFF